MSKIAILSICLVSISAVVADSEKFTGLWTPVAMFPNVVKDMKECYSTIFSSSNKQCSCEDGKKVTVLEARPADPSQASKDERLIIYPLYVVDNPNDVESALNVTCSCEGVEYPNRVVIRSVSSNYFIMYRYQDILPYDSKGAMLFARVIPSHQAVLDAVKGIEDLRDRAGAVFCDSEVAADTPAPVLQHSLNQLTKIFIPKV